MNVVCVGCRYYSLLLLFSLVLFRGDDDGGGILSFSFFSSLFTSQYLIAATSTMYCFLSCAFLVVVLVVLVVLVAVVTVVYSVKCDPSSFPTVCIHRVNKGKQNPSFHPPTIRDFLPSIYCRNRNRYTIVMHSHSLSKRSLQ